MVSNSLQVNSVLFAVWVFKLTSSQETLATAATVADLHASRTASIRFVPLLLMACHHVVMSTAALHHSTLHSGLCTPELNPGTE